MKQTLQNEAGRVVEDAMNGIRPQAALILGSGWGEVTRIFEPTVQLPYSRIPGMGAATVSGHQGILALGEIADLPTLIFQGRRHWYENAGWDPVLLPVRICHALGIRRLIITNAAGGIRDDLSPGTMMLISDHINAMGVNPLSARQPAECMPFFNDQSAIYDQPMRIMAQRAAADAGIAAKEGVYLAVSGPAYETPAEIRMFRSWGADAVGMSTVPEAMLGNALGMRILGLSFITNRAAGLQTEALSHEEVTAALQTSLQHTRKMLKILWEEMK